MTDQLTMIIENKMQLDQLLKEKEILILYFSTPNCSVCPALLPKVLNLAQDYEVPVAEINAQELREVAGQFLIFTVPTLLVMFEGKEILRESRFIDLLNVGRILDTVSK